MVGRSFVFRREKGLSDQLRGAFYESRLPIQVGKDNYCCIEFRIQDDYRPASGHVAGVVVNLPSLPVRSNSPSKTDPCFLSIRCFLRCVEQLAALAI